MQRYFGVGKRWYSLDCIVTKLKEPGEGMIHSVVIYMNMRKRLQLFLHYLFSWLRIALQNRIEETDFAIV